MKKVVLAFSGGLDTSFCCIYLSRDLGLEVHSVIVNTGGFSEEELKNIEKRAYELGVKSHTTIDETEDYYQDTIKYLIFGNVLKNATYPLSVSAERVCQATAIANYAKKIGAECVAHGSTGAGNDQVRFDMIFQTLIPGVEIITPIRDLQLSREAEIDYLNSHGVEYSADKAKYSINKGLWGTSVGGAETLTSNEYLPESAWPTPVTSTEPRKITVDFEQGQPVALDGVKMDPVKVIQELQAIAQPYGIGRDIHVGDTIIGIKGRVGFEAAGPVILIKAHHALEKHTLTKWQLSWKDQLAAFYGNYMHEGQMHDPVMRDMEAFLQSSQDTVSGRVFIELHPYRFTILGIESEHDLMSNKFGSYGEMNKGYTGDDVKGFSKIFGNQTIIWHKVNNKG
ncbi:MULTISPECIES: argininosuccinate synthase [Sphingobacterium]|uniref:argininosuccinate synthase n=1 Tax=Sphingobacterium cellulitidis TaxID=1768011 RepID=A0A8H9KU49_9SPHI|nr:MULTISPECIES: argininosuccinate synthase [Sphingobacterium]MBA8987924.1 argininosuccinate synthase [Sphingobacterium soli]OYD41311.1 argininosuccinate synthase [Sphingobacterium cellulitidis]OYD45926.1 argininosuccinate synthase [Sphingobacterium cellulitidis]WFB62878.1 argininosuccinate synthase [Sphingobacterium sp. WM]GGE25906.1 argininosuccinate synthase [Sphingobacterium soli]